MTDLEHLERIAEECEYELSYLRIPIGNVKAYTINRRATTRWGQCRKRPDGYYININSILCDGKHDDGLRSTIFHELVHTCPDCMNHGQEWKHWAAIIYEHTGCVIKRTDSCEEKGVEKLPLKTKYSFKCAQCGATVERQRKSKFTNNYKNYRCGRCGGTFVAIIGTSQG